MSASVQRVLATAAVTALSCVAALFVVISLGTLRTWYPLDYGEGILLDQVVRVAHGVNIYRPFGAPPYYFGNYPPLFLIMQAPFVWLAGPAFWYGRAISQVSILVAAAALGATVFRLTRDRLAALIAGLLVTAVPLLVFWAQLNRVDVCALALGWLGILAVADPERPAVGWAALAIVAAGFTRQTSWAAPSVAVVAHLLASRRYSSAWRFLAYVAVMSACVIGVLQLGTGGWFLRHVLGRAGDPWNSSKLWLGVRHATSELRMIGPVACAAICIALFTRRPGAVLAAAYLAVAAVEGLFIMKLGSYWNYFIEFGAALVFITGLAVSWSRDASGEEREGRVAFQAAHAVVLLSVIAQAFWVVRIDLQYRPMPGSETRVLYQIFRQTPDPIVTDMANGLLPLAGKTFYMEPFTTTLYMQQHPEYARGFRDDLINRRINLFALRRTRFGYVDYQWGIRTVNEISRYYKDCGHVPVEDGTGDYYVLYRPACPPGETQFR